MRIEQLTKKQKFIRPNMEYLINFNGTCQYFSKNAILELQSKLNKLFIHSVVDSCDKKECEHEGGKIDGLCYECWGS
tara:strand:+ start:630 stop:860 length:231 start_codon:yes stop_codon:yes gene_type:complete